MKTSQENLNQETTQPNKEVYEKPAIEIIEMETEGSILASSDYEPGGGYPGW